MGTAITISFSDEVLRALRKGAPIKLALVSPGGAARMGRAGATRRSRKAATPREGSLPAKLQEFAKSQGKPFTTANVSEALKLSRAHASMLLVKAVASRSLRREGRGVYVAG